MKTLTITVIAVAGLLTSAPAFAQTQGSNQAAGYALSLGVVGGGHGDFGNAYARGGRDTIRRQSAPFADNGAYDAYGDVRPARAGSIPYDASSPAYAPGQSGFDGSGDFQLQGRQ